MYSLKRYFKFISCVTIIILIYVFGVYVHPFEKNFYTNFHYPFDGDIEDLVNKLKNSQELPIRPINRYNFDFSLSPKEKCSNVEDLRLVYVIKSAPNHYDQRKAIRSTWGYEKRFSDVQIRTVFLLGLQSSSNIQNLIDQENAKYKDIIQADFQDSYYNNTYKTMSGFQWLMSYCNNSKFYMFVDDDYYVSTKNVLRYIRSPKQYPKYLKDSYHVAESVIYRKLNSNENEDIRLYAGAAFDSAPHRHLTSKWYISLEEYPYHMFPPYITAGAYILSNAALIDMWYGSFFTKHFRFDDIYLGLIAYKIKLDPLDCEEFYFYKKPYYKKEYKYTIASHGFSDPTEMVNVWLEQKSLGHA